MRFGVIILPTFKGTFSPQDPLWIPTIESDYPSISMTGHPLCPGRLEILYLNSSSFSLISAIFWDAVNPHCLAFKSGL